MRLAGTTPLDYDEHGAYRELLYKDDISGMIAVLRTLRWNGERWASGERHCPFNVLPLSRFNMIQQCVELGMFTPEQAETILGL